MTLAEQIRALSFANVSAYDSGWNAALERVAELAEAQAGLVAAAYEAAAQTAYLWGDHEEAERLRDTLRAMTPADALAELARIKAEARREGMREAASLAAEIAERTRPDGMAYHTGVMDVVDAIRAAAGEADNG